MSQQIQFIGFTPEEAKLFIRSIIKECLEEIVLPSKEAVETPITIKEACKVLGVSAPTLRKFVEQALIRRHDMGIKKKVFYLSELEEDIKLIQTKTLNEQYKG